RSDAYNAHAFTPEGYYRTGDLVRLTRAGDVVVEGRCKDQINRAGEKIAAPEIEDLLCRHPSIIDAALIAVPDPYLGERSLGFLVTDGWTPKLPDIHAHLRKQGVAEYKLPDAIRVMDRLPTTRIGKLDKRALLRLVTG